MATMMRSTVAAEEAPPEYRAAAAGRRVLIAHAAGHVFEDEIITPPSRQHRDFTQPARERSRRRWSNRSNTCARRRRCIRSESSRSRERGTVLLRVLVDALGRPAQIQVERSSGLRASRHAARDAVQKALFRPYEVNGVAQPAQVLIPIEFTRRAT